MFTASRMNKWMNEWMKPQNILKLEDKLICVFCHHWTKGQSTTNQSTSRLLCCHENDESHARAEGTIWSVLKSTIDWEEAWRLAVMRSCGGGLCQQWQGNRPLTSSCSRPWKPWLTPSALNLCVTTMRTNARTAAFVPHAGAPTTMIAIRLFCKRRSVRSLQNQTMIFNKCLN